MKRRKIDFKALVSIISIILGISFILYDGYILIFKGGTYSILGITTLIGIIMMINEAGNYLQDKIERLSDKDE